MTIISIPEG